MSPSVYDRVAAVACRLLGVLDVQARAKDCRAVSVVAVLNTRSPSPPLATVVHFAENITMHYTRYIIVPALAFLSACSATGQAYQPTPITEGKAQVIVYRGNMPLTGTPIKVNGEKVCSLKPSSHFVVDADAGETMTLNYAPMMDWRQSNYAVKAKAGERYYVRLGMNQGNMVGSVALGMLGSIMSSDEAGMVFHEGTAEEAAQTKSMCEHLTN